MYRWWEDRIGPQGILLHGQHYEIKLVRMGKKNKVLKIYPCPRTWVILILMQRASKYKEERIAATPDQPM